MMKLLHTVVVFLTIIAAVSAGNVRREKSSDVKGVKKGRKGTAFHTRNLKKGKKGKKYASTDDDYYYYSTQKESKGGKKGGGGGAKTSASSDAQCQPVVEGGEFLIEGSLSYADSTEQANQPVGSSYVWNGPLLEFNENDELSAMEGYYISGSCIRTEAPLEISGYEGSGHCSFTMTFDTGGTFNFAGEVFQGMENTLAINGGSQEFIGLDGSVTLVGLSEDFETTEDDFLSARWMYGEVIMVYSVCPEGYWEDYYIVNHADLPESSIPDPFAFQATLEEHAATDHGHHHGIQHHYDDDHYHVSNHFHTSNQNQDDYYY